MAVIAPLEHFVGDDANQLQDLVGFLEGVADVHQGVAVHCQMDVIIMGLAQVEVVTN